ncbi:hypothetical protein [Wolbachia endosymbiont (group A) of Cheilosia soror]|uniref:hypothetical protein n=1 Tax=Wolbachia endosymbiont (group A) of Cheilosia soror TaxID=2953995 RepID=UPI0021F89A85|nr:hypothetical protein [Wolbachia endosymbiont (group A) of Cheilosia soror]
MYNTEIKIPVLPFLSSQCLTLGSSFLYKFTKSASFYNAKPILTKLNTLLAIKFPGCQCQATRMTPFFFLDPSVKHWDDKKRAVPSWMEASVSYFHDTLTTVIPLLVSGI